MNIKIDKNIPLPDNAKRCSFPVKEMLVGDSFFVPLTKQKHVHSLRCTVNAQVKRIVEIYKLSFKTTIREENKGVRVWRIE